MYRRTFPHLSQASQVVVINQAQEMALKDSAIGSASTATYVVSKFPLRKQKIYIIAK